MEIPSFYSAWYTFENNKLVIKLITKEGSKTIVPNVRPYCFIDARSAKIIEKISKDNRICTTIKTTPVKYKFIFDTNIPLARLEVDHPKQIRTLRETCKGSLFLESDIVYIRRWMIDNNLQIATDYKRLYWDMEIYTEPGQLGVKKTIEGELPIVSIAGVDDSGNRASFMGHYFKEKGDLKLLSKEELFEDEEEILDQFLMFVVNKGYTLLIGWNSEEFDTPILWKRVAKHDKGFASLVPPQMLRFLDLYKCFRRTRMGMWDSWKLEDVTYKIYGEKKVFRLSEKSLLSLTPEEMSRYNEDDADKVRHIDILDTVFEGETLLAEKVKAAMDSQASRLSNYFVELAAFTHLFPDESLQATKAADGLILNRARQKGYILPNKPGASRDETDSIQGAQVLDPIAGVHEWVLNLDFNSLYPNIIIFWKISADPERELYPNILKELIAKRKENKDLFKQTKQAVYNTKQQAFKILANAMYGAFVYPNFRLYNRENGEEVTRHGRELIMFVKNFVEKELAMKVAYGDTDSLFVVLSEKPVDVKGTAESLGDLITKKLRQEFGEDFNIRMEPKKLYSRILLTDKKKKYMGEVVWEEGKEVLYYDIVGMEGRRSDWTKLAKEVQETLGKHGLFKEDQQAYEYCQQLQVDLFLGKLDDKLILSKTVTKDVSEYVHAPPHVRAYKELLERGIFLEGGKIQYVMTLQGPKPLVDGQFPKEPLDYAYYWNKQVTPVAGRLGYILQEKGLRKRKKDGQSLQLDQWLYGGEDNSS